MDAAQPSTGSIAPAVRKKQITKFYLDVLEIGGSSAALMALVGASGIPLS
jgi:hypothetical protein